MQRTLALAVAAIPPARLLRRMLGVAIAAGGAISLLVQMLAWPVWSQPQIQGALMGGGLAALATALGTVPVLLRQTLNQRTCDAMLGFGAGVMLAACSFSLIIPALQAAREAGAAGWSPALQVGAAILAGALLLFAVERVLPHQGTVRLQGGPPSPWARGVWLFVIAIALHNVPEGLAIGVAFAGGNVSSAHALSLGIAIQDVPEGLVVALALRAAGYSRLGAVGLGIASGLVEPLAALAGVLLAGLSVAVLPIGLAMAAGAMLYVISHEIIPRAHRQGHEGLATGGLMLGFVVMLVLDVSAV